MSFLHPTALVDPGAELGADVEIGPYCIVGPNVRLGDGVRLLSHVVVAGHTTLGARCEAHPFASIGGKTQDLKYRGGAPRLEVGAGTVIRESATLNCATDDGGVTRVGSRCLMMAYSHVAHDCVVGDEVILANCVALAGHVTVEDQAILGGLSAVHQFVRVGRLSITGGCTKVIQDVPPYMMADGSPARIPSPNLTGLKRRGVGEAAQRQLKQAHRLLYREGLSTSQALARMERELDPGPEVNHLLEFIRGSERGIIH